MNRGFPVLAWALLLSVLARSTAAHQVPNSVVYFDFGSVSVRAQLLIPVSELKLSLPEVVNFDDVGAATGANAELSSYVLKHVYAETLTGLRWSAVIDSIRTRRFETHDYLDIALLMKPPEGGESRRFVWIDDAITHEVMNHFIMLIARSDFDAGLIGQDSVLLGFLQHPTRSFRIDLGAPKPGAGFKAAFALGVRHIAAGTDHLLFLFTLLLPASLVAAKGRWQSRRPLGSTLGRLAAIATAFTVGHSLTLGASGLFDWQLPAQPVEVLIALSILVSAIHAWRPLFAGREPVVGAGFGLVHGLAFAAVLGGHVVDPGSKASAILGFNLGIESVQIALVSVAAPFLSLLRPTGISVAVRRLGAVLAGIAASAWVIERMPRSEMLESALLLGRWSGHSAAAELLAVVLALAIAALTIARRARRQPSTRHTRSRSGASASASALASAPDPMNVTLSVSPGPD